MLNYESIPMNLLLATKEEIFQGNKLLLSDRRAKHLLEVCRVEVGKTLKIGLFGGGVGLCRVAECNQHQVELEIFEIEELSKTSNCIVPLTSIILALPRPQMLKRILQLVGAFGVKHLHLIGSHRTEKSYFHSPVLKPAKIEEELILGMEQGMKTFLPEVIIYPSFNRFMRDSLPTLLKPGMTLLLPDLASDKYLSDLIKGVNAGGEVLAIGPEGGWITPELEAFKALGFQSFTLGNTVLRVENAVCFALGQLTLVKEHQRR
jgi:16S rRNA (uracil1498-N3)-methyltransferase